MFRCVILKVAFLKGLGLFVLVRDEKEVFVLVVIFF